MIIIPHWQFLIDNWAVEFESKDGIFAFILYSPADIVLSNYFATLEYWNDLHELSGNRCHNFIIEKPKPNFKTWEKFSIDDRETFDKSEIYDIARRFGINPNQIPCIVFFKDIKNLEEIIICEFKIKPNTNLKEIHNFLRQIYTPIFKFKTRTFNSKQKLLEHRKKMLKTLKKGLMKLKAKTFLKKVSSRVMGEVIEALFRQLILKRE